MPTPHILYLCINLPHSTDRKKHMLAQAEKFGIELQFVEAVYGKELTPEQLACYDAEHFRKYFAYDLTPNEIACALSHRKALKFFLESGADYGLILEDDAVLQPHFHEGIYELMARLHGWDAAKLQLGKSARPKELLPHCAEAPVQPVYTRKLGARATGYLYTRRAADVLYREWSRFWLPADGQIMQFILDHHMSAIGVCPEIVTNADMPSDIDSDSSHLRGSKPRRTPVQYVRHRWRVLLNTLKKVRLYLFLRRHLTRV